MSSREILFGKKKIDPLDLGLYNHWAIKVGETWYEIPGSGISDTGTKNKVEKSTGEQSMKGSVPSVVKFEGVDS